MKNMSIFIVFIIFLLASVTQGQDTRKYDLAGFTGIDVGWGMHVQVSQSDQYSIEVKAEERDFKYLKVETDNNILKVYIDKRNYKMRDDVYITVSMPELTSVSLHGGAVGKFSMKVPSENFSAVLSGGAQLKGNLECSDIDIDLSGGSQVTIDGKAGDLKADGSGGAMFRLKDFAVTNVDAELSGGSMLYVKMNGKINVDASGGSQVKYYGNASLGSLDFSGGSGISEGN